MLFSKQAPLLLIFSILLSLPGFSQHNQAAPSTLIDAIARSNLYETGKAVGIAGTLSSQYQRFTQLLRLSPGVLVKQARQHSNAVVRLYCYQALKQQKASIPVALTLQFSHDSSLVKTLNGCIGGEERVYSLYRNTVFE